MPKRYWLASDKKHSKSGPKCPVLGWSFITMPESRKRSVFEFCSVFVVQISDPYCILYLLLILSHTACTAAEEKTLLAQLEPPLELVEILEEIHCR